MHFNFRDDLICSMKMNQLHCSAFRMHSLWLVCAFVSLRSLCLIEATACTKNLSPTTLSISYTAAGTFTVSPQNLVTTGTDECFIRMSSWNGSPVSVDLHSSCSGGAVLSFTKTTNGNSLDDFLFGQSFTFQLFRYTDATKASLVCQTSSFSVTPALCRGGNYALASLNVVKRPFSTMDSFITNKPLRGDCVYYLTSWAGITATDTVTKTDCSGTSFKKAPFTFGSAYTVKLVNFNSGAAIATDTPLCGINSVTVNPATSSATLSISDVAYGVVKVGISGAAWGSKCEVSLAYWNGSDLSSKALRRISTDCSSVTFSADDVGAAFGFGTAYSVEMAEYAVTDGNLAVVNPRSTTAIESKTISAETCASASLKFDRLDPISVGVSVLGGKPYGSCRITLVSYDGSAKSMVRIGLCSSYFLFTSDGDVWFESGKQAVFKYEFFASGDLKGSPDCTSTNAIYTIASYTCGQAITMSSQLGQYVFSVAQPQPLVGTCKLYISNCAGSTQDPKELVFPSCSSSFALSYADLVSSLTDLAPGTSCDFNWKYYNGSNAICSSSGAVKTATIVVPLTITQGPPASGSISVNMSAGLPSALSNYFTSSGKTAVCKARNSGCSGAVVGSPTAVTVTGCNTAVTLSADMTPGDNCVIEVFAYAASDLNTPLGYSGKLSFSAAGPPAWGSTQVPTVTMYGDSCLQVGWSAPQSTGGSPVLCYEVQRKDALGSFFVIQNCTLGQTATSAVSCGLSSGVDYTFQVIAANKIGRSADRTSVSIAQRLEFLQSAPDSEYLTPAASQKTFVVGAFPSIQVQENNPTSPLGGLDTNTTDRLFVATLVSRCGLDSTNTIKRTLNSSETDYTAAVLPIPPNSRPAFTQVFLPVQGSPGVYKLIADSQPPAGAYSLITYSLEAGGLFGQYWANQTFSTNAPTLSRKDPVMNLDWGLGPLIDTSSVRFTELVSIRWTGFVEAMFSEAYTFLVYTNNDKVRLWIDDVIIINKWDTNNLCSPVCSGFASLSQSSTFNRRFSSIRIDFVHSTESGSSKSAFFTLKWVSASQPMQVIPPSRLFKGRAIQSLAKTINVVPDVVSPASSTFSLQSQAFTTDKQYTITVFARDIYGNIMASSDSQFKATFTGSAGPFKFSSIPVDASRNNGTYSIPFQITTAGTYSLAITETTSGTNVAASPITVSVSTGSAYQVAGAAAVAGTHVTDTAVVFTFDVKDSGGNTIDGSGLTEMPPIHVSALWTGDSETQSRLPVDDVALRSSRFGVLFTDATISYSAGKFQASILLPRAGIYNVDIGVDNGAAPDTISSLTLVSSASSMPPNALVVSTPFPPSDMAVGIPTSFTVQLRDQYMNAISTAVSGSPSVKVRLQSHPTVSNQVTCTPAATVGQYTCTLTPQVSGTNLALAVLVDGSFAAYVYDNSGQIMYSRGPWLVNVSSGSVSASHCLLGGVRKSYTAGIAANATLLLRDALNNNLGPVDSWPSISAILTDNAATTITMDTSTFVYDLKAGTVIIPIVAAQTETGLSLQVTVDGVPVPVPYGIGSASISVIGGVVSASATDCVAFSSGTAGDTFSSYCMTKDAQTNGLSWPNLSIYTTFVHTVDRALARVTATGIVNANPERWDLSTSLLTKAGTYWYYTTVAQPGGLMAQYYALSTFEGIIGSLVNPLAADVTSAQYTQIDPFLDMDYQGPISVEGLTALSVVWSGSILAPVTGSVLFNITATGGVRINVGDEVMDWLSASAVSETFNVTMIQNTYYRIEIKYVPGNLAAIRLAWAYDGAPVSGQFTVPPAKLHALLTTGAGVSTVSVATANVSTKSIAAFSTGIVADQPDFVVIHAADEYGNLYTSLPDCVDGSGGTNDPTCLFELTLEQDDGTQFQTAVDLGDGSIKIPVTFKVDGPKYVHVKVLLYGGVKTPIHGSPFLIKVGPSNTATALPPAYGNVSGLGNYGMVPWGSDSGFVDSQAKWIWSEAAAVSSATVNNPVNFTGSFAGTAGVTAEIHAIVAGYGLVFANDVYLGEIAANGWTTSSYSKFTFSMTGTDNVKIMAWTMSTSAGLLVSIVNQSDTTQVYLRSSRDWNYTAVSPVYSDYAVGLGVTTMAPWGGAFSGFANLSQSRWIWDQSNAETVGDAYARVDFAKTFFGAAGDTATLHVMAAATASIFINGYYLADVQANGWLGSFTQIDFALSFVNTIKISCIGNPASTGLIVGVVRKSDPTAFYTISDASWSYNITAGSTAYVLGAHNMAPWSYQYFLDTQAKWIWSSANAYLWEPTEYVIFGDTFSGTPGVTAEVYIVVDESATVYVNGQDLGLQPGQVTGLPFTMAANNTIRVYAYNGWGPAGLLLSVVLQSDNTQVLARTGDPGWQYWYMNLFSLPDGQKAVNALGTYGGGPWGNAANFVDWNAYWIWNEPQATAYALANIWINFYKFFAGTAGETAVVHLIIDNSCYVYVDDVLLGSASGGWWTTDYPKFTITLKATQVIRVRARNAGGAAGLILSVVKQSDPSVVYTHTDSTWGYIKE